MSPLTLLPLFFSSIFTLFVRAQSIETFTCDSGCIIPSWQVNDGFWCNCDDCSDEADLTCSDCADGCLSYDNCQDGGGLSFCFKLNNDDVYDETLIKCSEIWDTNSTSDGCQIQSDFINDDFCDCPNCEDEQYWNCDACDEGCPTPNSTNGCGAPKHCLAPHQDAGVDLNLPCNFAFINGAPLVEGYCHGYSDNDGFSTSVTFNCERDSAGVWTVYNDSSTCDENTPAVTALAHLFSCGGSAQKCDIYKVSIDIFMNNISNGINGSDICSLDSSVKVSTEKGYYGNIGCVDDVKYTVNSEEGMSVSYYFDSDGSCSGPIGAQKNISASECSPVGYYYAQSVTSESVDPSDPSETDDGDISTTSFRLVVIAVFGIVYHSN